MAYQYANIKNHLHGIAVKGRLAYAMRPRPKVSNRKLLRPYSPSSALQPI